MTFELAFTPHAPSVAEQLTKQGFKFDANTIAEFQAKVDDVASKICGPYNPDLFTQLRDLANSIRIYVFNYVPPQEEPVKKKTAKKKVTKKSVTKKKTAKKPVKKAVKKTTKKKK